jgi:hypothetical protein
MKVLNQPVVQDTCYKFEGRSITSYTFQDLSYWTAVTGRHMHHTGLRFQFHTAVVFQMLIGFSVLHSFTGAVVTNVILLGFHN